MVPFFLNVHMVHPCFEAHNILVCLYYMGCDVWCMFYDVPNCVKVDIICNIVVYLFPFVFRIP
jgi:hypothetical protein